MKYEFLYRTPLEKVCDDYENVVAGVWRGALSKEWLAITIVSWKFGINFLEVTT